MTVPTPGTLTSTSSGYCSACRGGDALLEPDDLRLEGGVLGGGDLELAREGVEVDQTWPPSTATLRRSSPLPLRPLPLRVSRTCGAHWSADEKPPPYSEMGAPLTSNVRGAHCREEMPCRIRTDTFRP